MAESSRGYLRAINHYHAFGLAMVRLRQCSWCNPDLGKCDGGDYYSAGKPNHSMPDRFGAVLLGGLPITNLNMGTVRHLPDLGTSA